MKRSERLIQAAKRECTIGIICAFAVIGIGSQVGWLAESKAVIRAMACVGAVFFLSVACFACIGNAVRLYRLSREEREWESKRPMRTEP